MHDVLKSWGAGDDVCVAALLHSAYGTDGFQDWSLAWDRREQVRAGIGERAERLVYQYCITDRASQDADLFATGPEADMRSWGVRSDAGVADSAVTMDRDDWRDFTLLTLADWLEQVEGAALLPNTRFRYGVGQAWGYRRRAYARMAEVLGGEPQRLHAAVFGREPAETRAFCLDAPEPVGQGKRTIV